MVSYVLIDGVGASMREEEKEGASKGDGGSLVWMEETGAGAFYCNCLWQCQTARVCTAGSVWDICVWLQPGT